MTAEPTSDERSDHQVSERVALIVLAAGYGTRLRSAWPKPLHHVAGLPMIDLVLRAGSGAQPDSTIVVVSEATAEIATYLRAVPGVQTVVQEPPRGTGDAVRHALAAAGDARWLVVLFSDHPLLTPKIVAELLAGARAAQALVTVLTCALPDIGAYGRIARDERGRPVRIVERRADDPAMRLGPAEINSGMMVLDRAWAAEALPKIGPNPQTGEYFLTDLVELAVHERRASAQWWPVATVEADPEIAKGVNDRIQLATADGIIRERIRRRMMEQGVTLIGPESIYIDADVEIGEDSTILPFTYLQAGCRIGRQCVIGPGATLRACRLGNRVTVRSSTVVDSEIADGTDIGPYAHLRGDCKIGPGVHIGSHAEMKRAKLATGVKVGHFSYLGDATIGEQTNIGAGVVTANYDGTAKHETAIGSHAFIGSDSVLVAPVSVGDGALTGAGSVVTHDVPAGGRVVGVPARPMRRPTKDDGREERQQIATPRGERT